MKMSGIDKATTVEDTVEILVDNMGLWNTLFGATGLLENDLRKDHLYACATKTLSSLMSDILKKTITCRLLRKLNESQLLTRFSKMFDETDECGVKTVKAHCKFITTTQKTAVFIKTSLEKVLQFTKPSFKNLVGKVLDVLNEKIEDLSTGNILLIDIEDCSFLTHWINEVYGDAKVAHRLLESRMYWNTVSKHLGTNCDEWESFIVKAVNGNTPKEAIEDIRWLFCPDDSLIEVDSSQEVLGYFFKLLCGPIFETYKTWWDYISKPKTALIATVQNYFGHKVDMDKEIEIAKCCHIMVRSDVKRALKHFHNYLQCERKLQAIKDTMAAFKLDSSTDVRFHAACISFEKLYEKKGDALVLQDVDSAVQILESATQDMDEECFTVIEELVNASSLIEFLREVLSDDLRNLIDAVEEHSEQLMCESTVSDLIDVKQFLLPVLKKGFDQDVKEFFASFTKSKKSCGIQNIATKIHVCMENIHSLKALYDNVANKEENTKEVIKMINTNGSFRISMDRYPCEVYAECRQGKKVFEYSQSRLSDLRSRALLIMSTEEKRRSGRKGSHKSKMMEHLTNFAILTDTLFDIVHVYSKLGALGHFVWWGKSPQIAKPKEASLICDKLRSDLQRWETVLQNCRQEYYFINYVSSEHLPLIQSFLEQGGNEYTVLNILKYINPSVTLSNLGKLQESYNSTAANGDIEKQLNRTGQAIQSVFQSIDPIERYFPHTEDNTVSLTERVLESRLHISVLDYGSHLVLHTVLALYRNTTGLFPESNHLLFCNKQTKYDELTLFFNRCLAANANGLNKTLFCVVNAELLHFDLQLKLTSLLHCLPRKEKFLLAVVCSGRDQCTFLESFQESIVSIRPLTDVQLRECFRCKWPNVITITSDIPGLGKTERIHDMAAQEKKGVKTLHISGPFDKNSITDQLLNLRLRNHHLLHIDIGMVNDPVALDLFLFELIITGYIVTSQNAFALPTCAVCIEVANSLNNTLIDSLSTVLHFQRMNLKWQNYENMKIASNINSPIQVVCHYLHHLDCHTVDSADIYFTGHLKAQALQSEKCKLLLRKYFSSASDMSFTLVGIFIRVLADQLKKMSASIFFRQSSITAMLGDKGDHSVKSKLVNTLLEVSKEFATRSINTCRSSQTVVVEKKTEDATKLTQAQTLAARVQGMIRWDESNHLVVIFHHDVQTVSALFRKITEVPDTVKNLFESQMKKRLDDLQKASPEELQQILLRFTSSNRVTQKGFLSSLSASYALTPDNLLKMILVVLRLQASVPVVIMGETGCGKTSLVRYLSLISDFELDILSIHAGTTEENILAKIKNIQQLALENLSSRRWLFLDEINTCDHLGLITDIVCHHKYKGQPLMPNISVIAACNPYRLRSQHAIYTEGLQGKVKDDELSQLVYRVHPLPETVIDFVWDYGRLSDNDEKRYIKTMVGNVFPSSQLSDAFVASLSISQQFIRNLENADYSVSLRDVDRCINLSSWFLDMMKKRGNASSSTEVRNSIVLALAISYHSRICNVDMRKQYRDEIAAVFNSVVNYTYLAVNEKYILKIIKDEENEILNRMEIPEGIARNAALQENVFVILVSILNRIPVFVVGKPGCSKSLSMQLIRSNLRGKDSKDEYFKTLPQLFCVSFQGSESSTSDGIIKVFEKAKRYQDRNSSEQVLSVVILDEIGLAEISRFNPLKVLHGLLEPDGKKVPDVAVVGISNWALDAAKMNRAIHLSRPEMTADELYETALSISRSMIPETTMASSIWTCPEITPSIKLDEDIRLILKALAFAFNDYITYQRFKNFHGLRDYYSLTKYISRGLVTSEFKITADQKKTLLSQGLFRNFGGITTEMENLINVFNHHLHIIVDRKIPVLELIRDNLADTSCRHLLLITQGDAVISKLEQLLEESEKEYVVIFGSQFQDDLTDDYNYRILSRIILCMEQGLVLILKDLENIYGSLYDMLNQNYTVVGKKKNCRVALGPYSNPMCHVHDDFKCVVLVDENDLDFSDPPFLNRFEKQQFRFSDMLQSCDVKIIEELSSMLKSFVHIPGTQFSIQHAFPVFGTDVLSSLVLIVKDVLDATKEHDIIRICLRQILPLMFPEAVFRASKSTLASERPSWIKQLTDDYFSLPIHNGLEYFILHCFDDQSTDEQLQKSKRLFVIFTHSNMHVNLHNIRVKYRTQIEKIGAFKSEKDLTLSIGNFFENEQEHLLIQFDAKYDMQHFLLAKIAIENKRMEYLKQTPSGNQLSKTVYLVIHLGIDYNTDTCISQIHFASGWDMVTLDSLECPNTSILKLRGKTVSDVVLGMSPLHSIISEQLLWAFTRIHYSRGDRRSCDLEMIRNLENSNIFLHFINDFVKSQVENLENDDLEWQVDISCDEHALCSAGTYIGAVENHILDVIRKPLAMFIFKLELESSLHSFFIEDDESDQRRNTWKILLKNKAFCSFEGIPLPTGPACYSCNTAAIHLNVPFSNGIINEIEEFRDDFLETLRKVKIQSGHYDAEDEIPIEIVHNLLDGYSDVVTSKSRIAALEEFEYSGMKTDYFHDFCNIISLAYSNQLNEMSRIEAMQWAFDAMFSWEKESFAKSVLLLHAINWAYSHKLNCIVSVLELISSCESMPICDFTAKFDVCCEKDVGGQELMESLTLEVDAGGENTDDSSTILDEELLKPLNEYGLSETLESNFVEPLIHNSGLPDSANNSVTEPVGKVDRLVMYVSSMLLPTTANFENQAFDTWLHNVSRALPLIRQLSSNSETSYKLQFTYDLASILILPYNLQHSILSFVGDRLHHTNSLLDKDILTHILSMLHNLPEIPPMIMKKVISLYVNRCIQTEPDSDEVFVWIFEKIEQEDICNPQTSFLLPDFHFMGPLLQFAVSVQHCEDSDAIWSAMNASDEWRNNTFFMSLDHCLSTLTPQGQLFEGLSTIIVHIIEDEVFMEGVPEECSDLQKLLSLGLSFLSSQEVRNPSFMQILCVSFIRYIVCKFVEKFLREISSIETDASLLQRMNALMESTVEHGSEEGDATGPLLFFLQHAKQIIGLKSVLFRCNQLSDSMPIFTTITCPQDLTSFCIEFNPLEFDLNPLESGCTCDVLKEVHEACSIWEEKPDKLRNVCRNMEQSPDYFICVGNVLLKSFLQRAFVPIHEADSKLIATVLKYLPKESLQLHDRKLLQSLGGEEDFAHKLFHINTETNELDIHIVSVLLHILCIIPLYGKPGCLFYDTILKPECVKHDDIQKLQRILTPCETDTIPYIPCSCGVIYISSTGKCPSCESTKKITELPIRPLIQLGTIDVGSSLVYTLFQFFVHACCVCAHALCADKKDPLLRLLHVDDSEHDVSDILQDVIIADWNRLSSQLNLNNSDVCCLLNIFLSKHRETFLQLKVGSTDIADQNRLIDFMDHSRALCKNRYEVLRTYRKTFTSKLDNISPVILALECGDLDERPTLYRITDTATVDNLKAELSLFPEPEYAFLRLVLSNLQILSLPQYIPDILNWHLSVVHLLGYKVRKVECQEQTIKSMLQSITDDDAKERLKDRFKKFERAWNTLKDHNSCLSKCCPSIPEMKLMTGNSYASECMMMDSKSSIYQVLCTLIGIQNNLLHKAMLISRSKDCTSFNTFSCGPDSAMVRSVSLLDIKQKDVLSFEWNNEYLRFSQCRPNTGKGRGVLYDFHKIEKEMANELVYEKPFIINTESMPMIDFADELFRNSVILLQRIADDISPQEPLSHQILRGLEQKQEHSNSFTVDLITQVGIVLSLLGKTGGDAQTVLIDYLSKWKDYVSYKVIRKLLPEPENSVRLCHIVALYEYLELHSGEEISETLDSRFREQLSSECTKQLQSAKQSLSELNIVSKVLKIFVHRNCSTKDVRVDLQRPLKNYLMDPIYWGRDISVRNGILDESTEEAQAILHILSPNCLGENLYQLMMFLKTAIEDHKASEMRISSAAAAYKETMASRNQQGKMRKRKASKLLGKS